MQKLKKQLDESNRKHERQKLNKEKEALQVTTEFLTVRLNSVNDILALQEEKRVEKISSLEQEVKEKYQSSVFQHSLQDRTAALDLERVAWEA
ncbi:uncharacterized protein LOC110534918 isoform X2 [Oncorhynchus mykiss]|uniref:uncharacterized protein LOC110534918 isoform X2 n=1 Tax=Oncorhynchus mykiss TaxID=8022 RepID=UPI0018786709|nr:uncharacterized protein LOC110534918 isoform X2 [Oncorhynchus mykiss]